MDDNGILPERSKAGFQPILPGNAFSLRPSLSGDGALVYSSSSSHFNVFCCLLAIIIIRPGTKCQEIFLSKCV
jgi:hypothetical protein